MGVALLTSPSAVHRPSIVERPWGHEEIFALVEGKFCGKVLHVRAGHALSLQYHRQKEEVISVLQGTARVEIGDDFFLLAVVLQRQGVASTHMQYLSAELPFHEREDFFMPPWPFNDARPMHGRWTCQQGDPHWSAGYGTLGYELRLGAGTRAVLETDIRSGLTALGLRRPLFRWYPLYGRPTLLTRRPVSRLGVRSGPGCGSTAPPVAKAAPRRWRSQCLLHAASPLRVSRSSIAAS